MSHSASGRHRAQAGAPRTTSTRALAWTLVAAVVLGLAGWGLADRIRDPDVAPSTPSGQTPTPTATPSSPSGAPQVVTERIVTITGSQVTVEETSTLAAGGQARGVPAVKSPPGLSFVGATVVSADGRNEPFDAPVALAQPGSLTVRGHYRLTDCPDLLPVQWPSPAEFPGATRSYTRLEEPLHTAYALCPDQPTRAASEDRLRGTLAPGTTTAVRLAWSGITPLTITAVGSAASVAAVVVEPGCGGTCVAQLNPGGAATVTLQPVDPCPPATDDDRLTLELDDGRLVAVHVPDLHEAICD